MDPAPPDWARGAGVVIGDASAPPGLVVIAVKPQMINDALSRVAAYGGGGSVFLSVAAGTTIAALERALGPGTPVVRAMPNTPAAIRQGITAIVANAAGASAMVLAEALMGAVGQVVRLGDEGQIDAVTAVSGSGPAYVFAMIEALAAAGVAEGLAPDLALRLARATVAGAGALAVADGGDPAALRRDVTSPQGTTAAALEVLMDAGNGLAPLLRRAVAAAAARSRALR
jgi:pyrroline-5-carboxylate reductase